MTGRWGRLAILVVVPAAMACGTRSTADEPQLVVVRTSDYAFDAPDSIPAGLVTFRMEAGGSELHHVQIFRLDEGRTFADFTAAIQQAEGPLPSWMHAMGGPNGANPGASSDATMHLVPGSYVLACFIPSHDGVPHLAKGMMRPLTVTGDAGAERRPASELTITLRDYEFDLSEPIAAGRRSIMVENAGEAPHEVIFVRLAPGATGQDVTRWVEAGMHGEPPASGIGGTAALDRGQWNHVEVEFERGQNYALLCFIPGPDGRTHASHGMVHELRIE